jgi:DNA adenine methylase
MGRVNYDIPSRLYFSNPTGWNITETDALEEARDCLKDVRVSCSNYAQLFEEDGEDVIIYADPPYYVQTNTAASSQLYQYCFTKEDHVRLHDIIKGCKHKVCLSYDNDDEGFIMKLFSDMNIIEDQWTYCGTCSSDGHSKKKRQGKELIITNY